MKRTILSILLLFSLTTLLGFAQSRNSLVCRLGFTYDISLSPNWGKGKPVISTILPYTPAEQAGISRGDVIEMIDGVPVSSVAPHEIAHMLNPAGKNQVTLTVSNIASHVKQVVVKKECKRANSITEDQLATSFAMYSLESTSEQEFTCPFKTTATSDSVNFARFKTYAFAPIDENNRKFETTINECIGKELHKKGMTPNPQQPDVLIQTFYYFDKNPNYKGTNLVTVEREPTHRFNSTTSKMEQFPFLNSASAEAEAGFVLQFGFRLIDQCDVPGRILWECEANELMNDSYRIDTYARVHVPLMCMQYPYLKYSRNVKFVSHKRSYNYTGISYDIDRMELVNEVHPNSPAQAAGIRPKDVIESIGDHRMNHTAEEFSAAYKQFITKTISYRDPKTQFTDANGFKRCMLWDTFKYPQVANTIQQKSYLGAFSYLYFFAPYINPSGNNACTFRVKRGKSELEVIIRPTIRSEVSIEIK